MVCVCVSEREGWSRNSKLQVCVIPFEYSSLVSFITAPSITSLDVTRLNMTTFNLSVSLAYTGGGDITHFRVSFRDTRTTPWTPPENIPVTSSPDSSLVWTGVMRRDEFDTSTSLTFQVLAVNMEGLVSAEALATFPGMFCDQYNMVCFMSQHVSLFPSVCSCSQLPQVHQTLMWVPLLISVHHPLLHLQHLHLV